MVTFHHDLAEKHSKTDGSGQLRTLLQHSNCKVWGATEQGQINVENLDTVPVIELVQTTNDLAEL
jgi:hypothetical protein